MSGLFSITVAEARGFSAVPADLDNLAVVIGLSSLGSGLSAFYLSGSSAVAALGYGDGVDTLTQVIEQRQEGGNGVKRPAAFYTVAVDADGSYGAVDSTGITGSGIVAMDAASKPLITSQAGLQWAVGGVVATTGMVLRWTLDNGRTWSQGVSLGTATNYTIPNTAIKFEFSPSAIDTTALNTLLTELKDDYELHRVLTAGPVHGAADTANVVTEADATNAATRLALANELRTLFTAHRILIAGGVHGAADTTNVLVAPVAIDDSTVLTLALDLKAKYNAHIILTDAGVHAGADGSNTITSPDPDAGTFTAGDEVYVDTLAPTPSTSAVAAAFVALAASSANFALVVLDPPADAAMAAVITTGLNALATAGKLCAAIIRTRLPDFEASETDTAWGTAIAADFASFDDSRICVRAAYNLITDAMTTRQYRRSTLAQLAADAVRVGRYVWPASPNDRPEPNVIMVDASGATIGHDEGPRGEFTGLSNDTLGNRFSCEMRLPDPNRMEDVFNTVPWVMYAADERIRNLMTRRLANAMEREAKSAAIPNLGGTLLYVPTGGGSGTLTAASRKAVHGTIFRALKDQFKDEIDNANDAAIDTGLVQVSPTVTVTGGNLLTLAITLAPRVAGFVLAIDFTLAIQE